MVQKRLHQGSLSRNAPGTILTQTSRQAIFDYSDLTFVKLCFVDREWNKKMLKRELFKGVNSIMMFFKKTRNVCVFQFFGVLLAITLCMTISSAQTNVATSVSSTTNSQLGRFRVENELVNQQNGQKVKTITLFSDDLIYDFIDDHGEITLFDKKNDMFHFVEPMFRIQTQKRASEMKKLVEERRTRLRSHQSAQTGAQQNPFIAFALSPKFDETYEQESGLARFQSPWIDYQMTTQPLKNFQIRNEYYNYCDWNCYLNLHTNLTSPTLFARMEINRFLHERECFPQKIQVSVYPKGNRGITGIVNNPDVYISTHTLGIRWIPADETRVQRLAEQRKVFRSLPFKEYQEEIHKQQ